MLENIGRPQGLFTDRPPFVLTPVNKDDDARTAHIAAKAADDLVRAVSAQPPRPGHATMDDLPRVGSVVFDEHDGRAAVMSVLASPT